MTLAELILRIILALLFPPLGIIGLKDVGCGRRSRNGAASSPTPTFSGRSNRSTASRPSSSGTENGRREVTD